jgi:hypothetical protein
VPGRSCQRAEAEAPPAQPPQHGRSCRLGDRGALPRLGVRRHACAARRRGRGEVTLWGGAEMRAAETRGCIAAYPTPAKPPQNAAQRTKEDRRKNCNGVPRGEHA